MKESEKQLNGELPDWEQNPDHYLTDDSGNFILKRDGTPKKKPGRPKGKSSDYNYHSRTKAKMVQRKKISKAKRDIEKFEERLHRRKQRLKQKKEVLNKLDAIDGKKKTSTVIEEDKLDEITKQVREHVVEEDVIFKPNPGPQYDFLAAPEDDVLYGGAAGGGKSYAMLVDPLRGLNFKDHRALILRRTLNELRDLINTSHELYPQVYPGAKYNKSDKVWTFPNGCTIEFNYLEKDLDVYQYQGRAFTWIGFDEITQLPTEFAWNYLSSRLRTTNPQLDCYMRCTANPGGIGHAWVKDRYITPSDPGEPFTVTSPDGRFSVTRRFIPAKLADNPYLYKDGRYEANLALLPEVERRRLLEGDWDVADGMAFPEFNEWDHVIPPMIIPPYWERIKAIDYGYSAPSCVLWGAVDPEDNTLIIYKELYQSGLDGTSLGQKMIEMEREDIAWEFHRSVRGVIDYSVFARTGYTGPTIGETLIKMGHKIRPADKNRKGGKIQVHEWLRHAESGRPRLQIFSNCVNLIRELKSLPLAKNDPEDVDTHAEDHAYDALRYMIMSRPRRETMRDRLARYKTEVYIPADPITGY